MKLSSAINLFFVPIISYLKSEFPCHHQNTFYWMSDVEFELSKNFRALCLGVTNTSNNNSDEDVDDVDDKTLDNSSLTSVSTNDSSQVAHTNACDAEEDEMYRLAQEELADFDDEAEAPAAPRKKSVAVIEPEEPQASVFNETVTSTQDVKFRHGDIVYTCNQDIYNRATLALVDVEGKAIQGGSKFDGGLHPKLLLNAYSIGIRTNALCYYRRVRFLLNDLIIETSTQDSVFKRFARNWPPVPFAVIHVHFYKKEICDVRKHMHYGEVIEPGRGETSVYRGVMMLGIPKFVRLLKDDYFFKAVAFVMRPLSEVPPRDGTKRNACSEIQSKCVISFHSLTVKAAMSEATQAIYVAMFEMREDFLERFEFLMGDLNLSVTLALPGWQVDTSSERPNEEMVFTPPLPRSYRQVRDMSSGWFFDAGVNRNADLHLTAKGFECQSEYGLQYVLTHVYCKPRDAKTRRQGWAAYHERYLETAMALSSLWLPTYVVMWILDFTRQALTEIPEILKLRLIEGVQKSSTMVSQRRMGKHMRVE
jgi:hypothetical protein